MKAPFPWFGGKSRVAHLVWERFGDVRNYVEPFAGSLAVLLARPGEPKIETVNDLDCWIANFWRALQADPEQLAHWADWPVNEADLHARHLWLVKQAEFRERMKTDPDYYDVKIAGWWVWGISQWIGSGWCAKPEWEGRGGWRSVPRGTQCITPGRTNAGRAPRGIAAETVTQKRPRMGGQNPGTGVNKESLVIKRPRLGRGERGANRQIPDLSGNFGNGGMGVHASAISRKIPSIAAGPRRTMADELVASNGDLYDWFNALSDRLRRVRVCCGDWTRILGPAPTTCIGTTGVFLDPPYAVEERSDVYGEESRDVANQVREWAIANGDNPELRIALCGYQGEHDMPSIWEVIHWKANGGYANQQKEGTRGQKNAHRERIWFSPHCLSIGLFHGM